MQNETHLSRRERQIMDIMYELGEVTAAVVQERIPNPPGYSAVRAMLAKLEDKGHIKHRAEGARYWFTPTQKHEKASQSALRKMMKTFFENSPVQTVNALLDISSEKLSKEDLDQLSQLIDKAKVEGR